MTQLVKRWDQFTDTSLFTPYDRAPGVYLPEHVSVTPDKKLRFDCDQDGGWAGWFDGKAALYGRWQIGLQAFGGDALTGMVAELWPTSDVWAEGEMCIAEANFAGETVKAYHHRMTPGQEAMAEQVDYGVTWAKRNLFGVEWAPGVVRYLLNGVVRRTVRTHVPSTPHRFTFQSKPQPGSKAAYALVDSYSYELAV